MSKYEDRQGDILDGVEKDRKVIKREVQLIEELSRKLNTINQETKSESRANNVLVPSNALFIIAVLLYGWSGIVD